MAKQIVYYIVDNGIDGRAPTEIKYAFFDEKERNKFFANLDVKKSAYLSRAEAIVDVELRRKQAIKSMNGLQRLLLGFPQQRLS